MTKASFMGNRGQDILDTPDALFAELVVTDPIIQESLTSQFGPEVIEQTVQVLAANRVAMMDSALPHSVLTGDAVIDQAVAQWEQNEADDLDSTGQFSVPIDLLADKVKDADLAINASKLVEPRPLNPTEEDVVLTAVRKACRFKIHRWQSGTSEVQDVLLSGRSKALPGIRRNAHDYLVRHSPRRVERAVSRTMLLASLALRHIS